jgi:hypothetical protein
MRDNGFSEDEVKDLKPKEASAPATETPPPEPQLPAVQPKQTVPPIPEPTPGLYSPEKQQNALRAADSIPDPEMRMKVKAHLKREYANDAIMDGINGKAREEGIKTGVASYSRAVQQLRDDPHMDLAKKQQLVKMLTKTMWEDPRLEYGETKQHLEGAMQSLAFGENMMNLGPGYTAALDAVANGQITSARQILKMENDGSLTSKGYGMVLGRFNTLDKPDKAIDTRRESLAIKHITQTIMKGFDENSPIPGMKPTPKHYEMTDKAIQAFYDSIEAAGDDKAAVRKAMTLESVSALVDQVYPWDQRNADRVSYGQGAGAVTVPPTVATDARSQQAYKNIVGFPPQVPGKDGHSVQVPIANWAKGIEILRQTGQVDNFNAAFKTDLGARILKSLPYVAPPPGSNPPTVQPAEAPSHGWLSWMKPPTPPAVPGPDVISGAQAAGNKLMDKAFGAFNSAIGKTLPAAEAKK